MLHSSFKGFLERCHKVLKRVVFKEELGTSTENGYGYGFASSPSWAFLHSKWKPLLPPSKFFQSFYWKARMAPKCLLKVSFQNLCTFPFHPYKLRSFSLSAHIVLRGCVSGVRNRQHNFFWQGSKACKAHFQWKLNPELVEDDPPSLVKVAHFHA